MNQYDMDMAIENVLDDMDDYDYGYDDTDEFCDALESMVYDMADYLCYEQGYSEDEALEAANVYYGCALETSSQIKQMRNQARKTYNKSQKAAKRGDTYTAKQLAAQARNMDKKVRKAKNDVDAAVNVSHQQYQKRASQHYKQQSLKPGYHMPYEDGIPESKNAVSRAPRIDIHGNRVRYSPSEIPVHYSNSTTRDYSEVRNLRGHRGRSRIQNRNYSDYAVH